MDCVCDVVERFIEEVSFVEETTVVVSETTVSVVGIVIP